MSTRPTTPLSTSIPLSSPRSRLGLGLGRSELGQGLGLGLGRSGLGQTCEKSPRTVRDLTRASYLTPEVKALRQRFFTGDLQSKSLMEVKVGKEQYKYFAYIPALLTESSFFAGRAGAGEFLNSEGGLSMNPLSYHILASVNVASYINDFQEVWNQIFLHEFGSGFDVRNLYEQFKLHEYLGTFIMDDRISDNFSDSFQEALQKLIRGKERSVAAAELKALKEPILYMYSKFSSMGGFSCNLEPLIKRLYTSGELREAVRGIEKISPALRRLVGEGGSVGASTASSPSRFDLPSLSSLRSSIPLRGAVPSSINYSSALSTRGRDFGSYPSAAGRSAFTPSSVAPSDAARAASSAASGRPSTSTVFRSGPSSPYGSYSYRGGFEKQ